MQPSAHRIIKLIPVSTDDSTLLLAPHIEFSAYYCEAVLVPAGELGGCVRESEDFAEVAAGLGTELLGLVLAPAVDGGGGGD
jgi:hypothetical protein